MRRPPTPALAAQPSWQPEDANAWLQGHVLVAIIGYSIWVFDLRLPWEKKSDMENLWPRLLRPLASTAWPTAREMPRHTTALPDTPP